MLSVVIPTLDDEEPLALTLAALVPAAAEGIVREVVVADGGSRDGTLAVADATGCVIVAEGGPIGARLARGADTATRGEFLMFLRPGVLPDPRWAGEVAAFVERAARRGEADRRAAVLAFDLDDIGGSVRFRRVATGLVSILSGLPHPAQPLILSRRLYRHLGGHRPLAALEEIDLARRIGRRNIVRLRSSAALLPAADAAGGGAGRLRRGVTRALAVLPLPANLLVRLHG